MRIKPRFSFASRKKGLLADSSAIAALAIRADEEDGALDRSEAMSNQENEENRRKSKENFCLARKKMRENTL